MKNYYYFIFYKLYQFAKTQEKTIGAEFGFLGYSSIFELFHIAIILIFIKLIGVNFLVDKYTFVTTYFFLSVSLNYIIFIKWKRIYKIIDYFDKKEIGAIKGNLIVFSYLFFLFFLMFVEVMVYKKIDATAIRVH